MNGREVFRFATRAMPQAVQEVVEKAGLTLQDITLIIPHQANRRIIEAAARNLKMPIERFVMNIDRFGNTSTASIPLATYEAVRQARLRPGDRVVFVGFGAGLTWGACLVEWTGPKLPPTRPRKPPRKWHWYLQLARLRRLGRRLRRRLGL